MAKVRVPVYGTVGKSVRVNPDATDGAVIGQNLLMPDGRTVATLAALATALGVGAAANPNPLSVTLWGLIREIPANVVEVAALSTNGLVVRQADGSWVTREIVAGDGLTISNDDGDSGNPTLAVGAGTGIAVSADAVALSHLGLEDLSDPGADRLLFWDDSAGAVAWLTVGAGLTITGTTLDGFVLPAATTGDVLYYDGADWAATDAISIEPGVAVTVAEDLIVEGGDGLGMNLVLNYGQTGTPSLDAGIYVERGDSDDTAIVWDETDDEWQVSNDGTNFYRLLHEADVLGLDLLSDPGADRLLFWDDSAGALAWLTLGTNLSITGTTLNAAGITSVDWGDIGGTLSDQTDLQSALDAKANVVDLLGLDDLSDPGADRILYWDNSAGALAWLAALTVDVGNGVVYANGSTSGASFRALEDGGGVWFAVTSAGAMSINQATNDGTFEKIWISGARDGAVSLRHNNSIRLATTSTGIAVSNQVTAVGTTSADDEDGSRFGRSQTQCVVFAGDGVANKIVSLSDTGNSKNLRIRATTNAAGDAGSIDPSIVFVDRQNQELGRFWGNGGLTVGLPTGGNKGVGTINATAVYDDNVLLCMPVEEALGLKPTRDEWDRLSPTGYNALVDRHEVHKAEGWDGTAEAFVRLLEERKAVPGLATREEIAAQFDEDGAPVAKLSIGTKIEHLWLAMDYAAVAIRDLLRKNEELRAALEGRKA